MKKGVISAAIAYALWGFFPIYFKLLHSVPAVQITAHRFVWSFVLLLALVWLRGELPQLRAAATRKVLLVYLAAGALLSVNWLTYVWAVNSGFVLESSLGYFINPLVSVLLGVVFLREKLRPLQWVPVGLAAAGVIYLAIAYGSLPWISLVLAVSFGLYGLMKKIAPLGSLHGLTLETAVITPLALGYLLVCESQGTGAFGHAGTGMTFLLVLTGLVTAVPLLLFATGARNVPLTMIGLLQYIAPTLQFLIGVFLYGEPFTSERLVGFSIIWLALVIFTAEGLTARRRQMAKDALSAS